MRYLAAALLAALCVGVGQAQRFDPTPTPDKGGTRAVIDLPASQHMRNVGGSDGLGLCVFTSLVHSARWQNLTDLAGYRQWMQARPGGGYPSKVDATLKAYCREKGVSVPAYIQHTGGDSEFLDLAVKTGRCPAVTYCGPDDFYRGVVAHMVTLAHLDPNTAAIIDNNRPGVWVWMSRADFLARWRGNGGGWAVVFLAAPPPPHDSLADPLRLVADGCGCKAGEPCECGDGCKCGKPSQVFGQCANGRCVPAGVGAAGPSPIGSPPSDAHEWGVFPDGRWGWRFKLTPEPEKVGEVPTGVIPDPNPPAEYSHTGKPCSRLAALAALTGDPAGLEDDSHKWHLAAVGSPEFLARVRSDLAAHADRGKVLLSTYAPGAWQVSHFKLSDGLTLRRPAVDRVGATLGTVAGAEYSAARLADLIGCPGGPNPKPTPPPAPKTPDSPPVPAPGGVSLWVWIGGALLALFLFRNRKEG